MLRTMTIAAMLMVATGARAQMDCDAMFTKAEGMVAEATGMTTDQKVKAYRMAISAHEMCKDGKEEMAMKMYYETEEYIRIENERS